MQLNKNSKKDDDFLSKLKNKKDKLNYSLTEVEAFLSQTSCNIKYFKFFSSFKKNFINPKCKKKKF